MNIKFDLENKKNIITLGVFILVVVLLFQFVYFPKSRQVRMLTGEYKKVKMDIDELYNFIGRDENLETNIIEKRKGLAVLESAFPVEKEVANIIRQINEEARRLNVNVISLKPRDLEIYREGEGEGLKIADYFCKCMPLTLNVESRYRSLGEFLIGLEAGRAPMITIEEVYIERDQDKAPAVKAEIDLTAYVLGR